MKIKRRGRYWAVVDSEGQLICLAVYKKGGQEVIRRLAEERGLTNERETATNR